MESFKEYKEKYPHVPEDELKREFEDASGDYRHLRICSETGQWP